LPPHGREGVTAGEAGIVLIEALMVGPQVGRRYAESLAKSAAEYRGIAEAALRGSDADTDVCLRGVGQRVVGARQTSLLKILTNAADRPWSA
jgi:hypothetical protein